MTTYFVATRTIYVLIEANDEQQAREGALVPLRRLISETRSPETPIEIFTVRPATDEEIRLWNWHEEMLARHTD